MTAVGLPSFGDRDRKPAVSNKKGGGENVDSSRTAPQAAGRRKCTVYCVQPASQVQLDAWMRAEGAWIPVQVPVSILQCFGWVPWVLVWQLAGRKRSKSNFQRLEDGSHLHCTGLVHWVGSGATRWGEHRPAAGGGTTPLRAQGASGWPSIFISLAPFSFPTSYLTSCPGLDLSLLPHTPTLRTSHICRDERRRKVFTILENPEARKAYQAVQTLHCSVAASILCFFAIL